MKIEIKNVSKEFKNEIVLKDINLELNSNHIYGFTGPNGCGKSVLLKLICSFYQPTTGEILINGKNYNTSKDFPEMLRALIEKPSFLPNLTGYENLELLANIQKKITSETIVDYMKLVNLYEEKDKLYHKYSLGMKQKLGVISVLMEDPNIIILDEPFNGIEDKTKELLIKELKKIKKDKIIIVTSHIKEEIAKVCDETYSFEDGKIRKNGKRKI